jgi:hypothetical protein
MRSIEFGSTSQSTRIRALRSTGQPDTSLTHTSPELLLYYQRGNEAPVQITLAPLSSVEDSYTSGGFIHVSDGIYRVDVPDAAWGDGASGVVIFGTLDDNGVIIPSKHPLVGFDPLDDAITTVIAAMENVEDFDQGSVLFVDSEGRIAQDNSGLFWDVANKRLGLRVTPTSPLEVRDDGDNIPLAVFDGERSGVYAASSIRKGLWTARTHSNVADGMPSIEFQRRRGSTRGSFSAVQQGDFLGRFTFAGLGTSNLAAGAAFQAVVDGTVGAASIPTRFSISTGTNTSDRTERLVIRSDGRVGVGTGSPHDSALLDVSSTTRGFRLPRMTDAQRDVISSPAAGLIIYSTTQNKIHYYNGTAWRQLVDEAVP